MKHDSSSISSPTNDSLAGHLLVATPQMTDPRFKRAVIFICQHDTKAAMGLVINKPNTDLSFKKLAEHLNLDQSCLDSEEPVYTGGPVEPQRGYILHTDDQMLPETIPIANGICLSLHVDMVSEISRGLGPSFAKVMLGYAGWSAGQLEHEMRENMWVHLPATADILFQTNINDLWDKSFALIGLNPATLSSTAGTA